MHPPERESAGPLAKTGTTHEPTKSATRREVSKPGDLVIEADDARVKAMAIRLGVYAGMTNYVAANAHKGPHTAIVPLRVGGRAVLFMLHGGFPLAADNGWLAYVAADRPGALERMTERATRCFAAPPTAAVISDGRRN